MRYTPPAAVTVLDATLAAVAGLPATMPDTFEALSDRFDPAWRQRPADSGAFADCDGPDDDSDWGPADYDRAAEREYDARMGSW